MTEKEYQEIMLKITNLEKRIEELEAEKAAGGVILSGTPTYVRDYVKKQKESK